MKRVRGWKHSDSRVTHVVVDESIGEKLKSLPSRSLESTWYEGEERRGAERDQGEGETRWRLEGETRKGGRGLVGVGALLHRIEIEIAE